MSPYYPSMSRTLFLCTWWQFRLPKLEHCVRKLLTVCSCFLRAGESPSLDHRNSDLTRILRMMQLQQRLRVYAFFPKRVSNLILSQLLLPPFFFVVFVASTRICESSYLFRKQKSSPRFNGFCLLKLEPTQ